MNVVFIGDVKYEFLERLIEAVKADGHDVSVSHSAGGWEMLYCDHGKGEAVAKIRLRQNPWPDEPEDDEDEPEPVKMSRSLVANRSGLPQAWWDAARDEAITALDTAINENRKHDV